MNIMCGERGEKPVKLPDEIASEEKKEKKRFRVICATFLFSSVFILIHNVAYEQSSTLVEFVAQYLDLARGRSGQDVLPTRTSWFPPAENWNNLLVGKSTNYTSTLVEILHANDTGNSSCYGVRTNSTRLEGLPERVNGSHYLPTDQLHRLTLVSYSQNGTRRCAGGDYFEADFHDRDNLTYRSRLPTTDFGNGSYGLDLIVPGRFAGDFVLEVWLLFGNWHGMDYKQDNWNGSHADLMLTQGFRLGDSGLGSGSKGENLTRCSAGDFWRTTWQGRWTRSWYNGSCAADRAKRFRCLPAEQYECEEPWCFGKVGRLESNGWAYSAHCGFRIFERDEAWECLAGRWFLVWGDSNVQDTLRNLLLFVLGWELPLQQNLADFQLPRSYDAGFANPRRYEQLFRVSQIFNGHHLSWKNGEGLESLRHEDHQQALLAHFNGSDRWPDTVIMNSGLHDGWKHKTIDDFVDSADFAVRWWMRLYESIEAGRRPQMVWRSTVAPAGFSRKMQSNPSKMEMFNLIMVEKLQQVRDRLPVKFVDTFDLTFPFHYNNDYSDGGHYGRAPGTGLPPWHRKPHWYFVDIMLDHILLNAVCA